MNILAFDTCLDKMYVALSKDGKLADSKIVETTQTHYHSAFLISTIRDMLKNNNVSPQKVDTIATNIGPGSFTGIRACTTVARVFAQANGANVVGVSSLEILSKLSSSQKVLVALDARKEMAYVAIYENSKEVFAPKTILLEELKEIINKNEYDIITDDKLQPILGGESYQQSTEDLGAILALIAFEKIGADGDYSWKRLHPLYIQPPPVTCKK